MSADMLNMLKETAEMFVFLAVELTLLFLLISYIVGMLQEVITPEKVQAILTSKKGKGYVVAALLGAITPFCSCSTIPFLKGLLRARAGFGPMMVFLLASPLLNPIIIGLFAVTFGVKVAFFYFVIAMGVSVTAGFILEKLGFEQYIRQEAYAVPTSKTVDDNSCCDSTPDDEQSNSCCDTATTEIEKSKLNFSSKEESKWLRVWHSTWKDFTQVLPYLFIGILLGSFIYGFLPTEFIVQYAGENVWYAVPIAAVIGIPLYIRAEAVIPLSAALVKKGMALGSVMALIIGSAGASLTEVILLRAIFKHQMIIAFLAIILGMAITAGYLYGYLFG